MCQTVKVQRLSAQQQSELLQHEKLALVLPDLRADLLTLKGCRHLVYEVCPSVCLQSAILGLFCRLQYQICLFMTVLTERC